MDYTLLRFTYVNQYGDEGYVFNVIASINGKNLSNDIIKIIEDCFSSYIESHDIDDSDFDEALKAVTDCLDSFAKTGLIYKVLLDIADIRI